MIEAQNFPHPSALPQSKKATGFPGLRHPTDISIESVGYVEIFWGLRQSFEKVYTTFSMPTDLGTEQNILPSPPS